MNSQMSTRVEADSSQSQFAMSQMAEYSQTFSTLIKDRRESAKRQIESLVLGIINAVVEHRFPQFERQPMIHNSRDMRRATENPNRTTKIIFGGRSSRSFALQMQVMGVVYKMIQQNLSVTMRDLYYEHVNFYGNQNRLNDAIKGVTLLLKVPREALCVEVSAKGLVAGSISFRTAKGEILRASDCRHGMIVPSKLHELTIMTDAAFVLFVEKDAIFQRLIEERIFEMLGRMIMITGKGYPDLQTKRLLNILNKYHNLKVFAMVDCDPYGIEIAAVVKWGSYGSKAGADEDIHTTCDISVPDLIWLGLLPSDVASLYLPANASAELAERDKKKLQSVEERIKLNEDDLWLQEVRTLRTLGRKSELEALFSSPMFTTNVYLRSKLTPVINLSGALVYSSMGSTIF